MQADILDLIFDLPEKFPSEIKRLISRNRKLSSKYRRFLKDFAYGAARWRDRIWTSKPSEVDLDKVMEKIAYFQSETFSQVKDKVANLGTIEQKAHYLSYPKWMIEMWQQDYGLEKMVEIAWVQNQVSSPCTRVNTIVSSLDQVKRNFEAENLSYWEGKIDNSVYLEKRSSLRSLSSFKNGFFEIQDEHSQTVCKLIDPEEKDFVIDGCSRTGGKALHLASLQKDRGKIVCLDIDNRVFDELRRRAKRLAVESIQTRWIAKDDPLPCPDFRKKADIVLVDAPCSGIGTLRHAPHKKWSLRPEDLEEYKNRQLSILERQSAWVRPGGYLFYVTCSLSSTENQNVVKEFIDKSSFKLLEMKELFPEYSGGDGFFFSKMMC